MGHHRRDPAHLHPTARVQAEAGVPACREVTPRGCTSTVRDLGHPLAARVLATDALEMVTLPEWPAWPEINMEPPAFEPLLEDAVISAADPLDVLGAPDDGFTPGEGSASVG